MMKIGAFRAWVLKKIEENKIVAISQNLSRNECYDRAYLKAMQDVAEYFDFPLDDKLWEKWQP